MISAHKQIPILVYTDHYLEDSIYGLGEFDITANSRALKDEARSLAIETTRAQGGLITIDPDSAFDEAISQFGLRKYARVEKDAIGHFTPNINTNAVEYIEAKSDDDLIVESGIDFRSQLLGGNETATKVEGRIQAAKKRISQTIKYNAYTFYERLARIRSANMETWYSGKTTTVPVKGMDVDSSGNVRNISNGYGLFTMRPEYFAGKYNIVPIIDSMIGNTSSENKQKWLEVFQILINLKKSDGTPLYDPTQIIETGRGIIDEAIDLDKV